MTVVNRYSLGATPEGYVKGLSGMWADVKRIYERGCHRDQRISETERIDQDGGEKGAEKEISATGDSADDEVIFAAAKMLEEGVGLPNLMDLSLLLYTFLADREHNVAQCTLGVLYYEGKGVEKDIQKAFELYVKAADQGNPAAQKNLGLFYEHGIVIERDCVQAAKYSFPFPPHNKIRTFLNLF